LFKNAKAKMSSFLEENSHLQADAAKNACAAAADASIQAVFKEVQAQQSMLNRLRTGKKCRNKNANIVRQAGRLITSRSTQWRKTRNALSRTMNSRVKWTFSYRSMFGNKSRRCSKFYHSSSFKKVKAAVRGRKRDVTRAAARLSAARSNLRVQRLQRQVAKAKCFCSIRNEAYRQYRVANRASAARRKTLLSEMMVKCLASTKNASRCKRLRLSRSQLSRLRLRLTRLVPQTRGSCRRARKRVHCSMRTRYSWRTRHRMGWVTRYRTRRHCKRVLVTRYRTQRRCRRYEELLQKPGNGKHKQKKPLKVAAKKADMTEAQWGRRRRHRHRRHHHRRIRCWNARVPYRVWTTRCGNRRQAYRARARKSYRVRTAHRSRWCRLVNRL